MQGEGWERGRWDRGGIERKVKRHRMPRTPQGGPDRLFTHMERGRSIYFIYSTGERHPRGAAEDTGCSRHGLNRLITAMGEGGNILFQTSSGVVV